MTTKRTTKRVTIGSPLTKRLREMGCVYCAACRSFMFPDHGQHINLSGDWHESRYILVGDFGHVRAVEKDADFEEVA